VSRNRILLMAVLCTLTPLASACSEAATDVAPPVAASGAPSVAPSVTPSVAPAADVAPTAATGEPERDAAVSALHDYLREQAEAINAGVSGAAQVPEFTATLTPAGQEWALPLLAANLGDRMPGPYPVGVLASTRVSEDRVELDLCLQDRGWQVDRTSGQPLNAAHHGSAHAVVLRVGERWLVDDVAADGGDCAASDVVAERF
jgi:hypothetical protein